MVISRDLNFIPNGPTAVAVGFFDGVHRGHLAVIDAMLKEANQSGLVGCVFSFAIDSDSPAAKKGAGLLQTYRQKTRRIEQLGVDCLVMPDFTSFRDFTPSEFAVDLLCNRFGAKTVCCGYDYRFGKNAAAGPDELDALLTPHGVKVVKVEAVIDEGEPVSSTRIRQALKDGDAATAQRLLGRPFSIESVVEHGRRLGRQLGFPTANQPLGRHLVCPRHGVWATRVLLPEGTFRAVTNIGTKPTVGGDRVLCESYILDFEGDLYGRLIDIELISFIRPEIKFDSLEHLRAAVSADAEQVRGMNY